GVSGECEAREGLHIADDHFLPEIVDPTTGEPLGAREQGALELPTLTQRSMPVVRYRTGDVTTLTTAPCRCGRTSARMGRLVGRADDMLIIKGVNVYPSEVEGALLGVADLVPQYLLVVDRNATLARVEVQVEPAPAFLERCGSIQPDPPDVGKLRGEVDRHVAAHDEILTMRIEADRDIGTQRITSDKRVNIFYYPIDTWADFVFFNFCMDRGAGHQLEDVRQCSYGPWVRAIEGIFKEEKF